MSVLPHLYKIKTSTKKTTPTKHIKHLRTKSETKRIDRNRGFSRTMTHSWTMFSHNNGKFDWFLWRIWCCLPFSSLIILIVKTNIFVFSLINCQISFSTPPDTTSVVKESQRSRSGNMMWTVSLYLTKQT